MDAGDIELLAVTEDRCVANGHQRVALKLVLRVTNKQLLLECELTDMQWLAQVTMLKVAGGKCSRYGCHENERLLPREPVDLGIHRGERAR